MTFPFPSFVPRVSSAGVANWTLYDGTKDSVPAVLDNAQDFSGLNKVIPIDDTSALVLTVTDFGAGDALYAMIISVDTLGVVTQGTPVSIGFPAMNCGGGAAIMDSSHAVICWYDQSIPGVQALAIDFSGLSINTVGTAVSFFSGSLTAATQVNVVKLTSATFAINYMASGMHLVCGALSGTIVSNPGLSNDALVSNTSVNAGMRYIPLDAFDSTDVVVAYIDSSDNIRINIPTILGTVPTIGATTIIDLSSYNPSNFFSISLKKIDSSNALMMWSFTDNTGTEFGQICILTLTGGTLSVGAIAALSIDPSNTGTPTVSSIALPNSTQAVTYRQTSTFGHLQTIDIAGTTLTVNTLVTKTTAAGGNNRGGGIGSIGLDYVALLYADAHNTNFPTLQIITPK